MDQKLKEVTGAKTVVVLGYVARISQRQPEIWYIQNNGTETMWIWELKPVSLLETGPKQVSVIMKGS